MPGAGVEGVVEVGDEAVLGEVEFDLAEQFGPGDAPQLDGGEGRWGVWRGDGGHSGFPLLPPRGGEDQLGVDPVGVGGTEAEDQPVTDALSYVLGTKRPKRWASAPTAFRVPVRPSPSSR